MVKIIMLPELGHFALILAFGIAFLQVCIPLFGVIKNNDSCLQVASSAALSQCFFVCIAFFILIISFYRNDFSVVYVAQNSNAQLPLLYRLCALWGAHAGSLLLWIFMLNGWSALFAIFSKKIPLAVQSRVLITLGIVAIFFYWFLFAYANPFLRQFPPLMEGANLNPILQDLGLAIHPPLLYAGYVGFSVVFALAITGLWVGEFNAVWAKWMRPWAQLPWCFLTLGIVFGSWWSYRELGWGGFWFWDPVENASLMPWLVGTALLHALIVCEKRNLFSAWVVLLSIATFSLAILGTFLVRSGILISVHTFSLDPNRGLFLLQLFVMVVGVSLLLYAWRGRKLIQQGSIHLWSRESLILINNILLTVAMFTVLLGTLYPLFISALSTEKMSIGPPYFNTVLSPILILLLFFMLFTVKIKNWGMAFAHVGVIVTVIGIVLTSGFSQERKLSMRVGDHAKLGEYTFIFKGINNFHNKNYSGVQATIWIEKHHQVFAQLHPALREFKNPLVVIPKAAINATVFRDLYVALGNPLPNNEWTFLIDEKPFVRWIWFGGILMMLGGLISFVNKGLINAKN